MTYQKLNQYILHYLTKDKTKSAIMLTAPWGTGKSHYILNELKPFLGKEENGSHKCLVVSLYGLNSIFDVSKFIYLESRARFLNCDSEKVKTGKFAVKTIIKGLASYFGVDLSKTDDELKELFESIDLSGTLIVFEDLERSGIDIIEILGYVNNLVEQDGVKVLLVANEDEIIKYKPIEIKSREEQENIEFYDRISNHKNRAFTDKTVEYLKVKEKTIGDTIYFEEDYEAAIKDIISTFDNSVLKLFSNFESVNEILNSMQTYKSFNLRSFIYVCQKSVDVFNNIDTKYISNKGFVKAVFFGILIFVLKQRSGKTNEWGRETYFSAELGNVDAPLFKFCYDYIMYQNENFINIEETYHAFNDFVLYDDNRTNRDEDISVLQTYHTKTENDIRNALDNIEKRLNNPEDISFYQYGTIAVYAIILKDILKYDVKKIEDLLVSNLKGRGDKIKIEQIFRVILGDESTETQKEEYSIICKRMSESLNVNDLVIPNFKYESAQSVLFHDFIIQNEARFRYQKSFANNFDMSKLAEMFKTGSADQKDNIRGAFISIYRVSNVKEFFPNDKESIIQLLRIIEKDREDNVGDKIQQLQYDWFIDYLSKIADKLS